MYLEEDNCCIPRPVGNVFKVYINHKDHICVYRVTVELLSRNRLLQRREAILFVTSYTGDVVLEYVSVRHVWACICWITQYIVVKGYSNKPVLLSKNHRTFEHFISVLKLPHRPESFDFSPYVRLCWSIDSWSYVQGKLRPYYTNYENVFLSEN